MLKQLGLKVDIGIQPRHRELVKTWDTSRVYTPDIVRLEKYTHQLLFVCDELMSARRDHFLIEADIIHKVIGFTTDKFDYLLNPDGIALPIPREDGYVIKGEILVIRPNVFLKLDKFKLNRVQFVRRRVPITDPYRPYGVINNGVTHGYWTEDGTLLPEALQGKKLWVGDEHLHTQEAWMYQPHPDYWGYQFKRRPEIFDRVPRFQPKKEKTWLSEYFQYQNPKDR
jgi:hypothetical protein